jgi:diguanylate cyclase (GGDEF)-like protein
MEKPFALIIEDERDVAALFRHVLDLLGFRTELVFHGQTAIERLSHSLPDLVLLDLHLPGVPGSEVLQFIRKTEELNHTKVVVITGHAHVAGGLVTQPDLLLMKPVSVEQLMDLITRISLSDKSPQAVPLQENALDDRTSLYSQSFFQNRLESALKQSREIGSYLFAIFLFKLEPQTKKGVDAELWESTLGRVADMLKSILRPTDTIARFAADTFYIMIEDIPSGEMTIRIANRIQKVLYRKMSGIADKIRIPIRIGILLCDHGYEKTNLILSDARYALALASAQGDEYARFYYQVSTR